MGEKLELFLNQISQDDSLFDSVEEAVRQGVILPILAYLGWNTYNIHQVVPEFKAGGGKVDYCLKLGEKKAVFIEVKRVSVELDRHEKQLLEYSFAEGVDIAVLTNGLIWWFYLPLGSGNWKQRKFFTIDINQQSPKVAARNFQTFLSMDSVSSGQALNQAKSVHESRTKQRIIKKTVPEAWAELINGPDELLLELFSEKVEGMCGYRPDPQLLVDYLHTNFKTSQIRSTISRTPTTQTTVSKTEQNTKESRKKGVVVIINEKQFKAQSVRNLYLQILEFMVNQGYTDRIQSSLPFATSSKRYLLSREPFHPKGNAFVVPVEYNGYYMEAHKSYENAISALERLFILCDLSIEEVR